jgi:serine/threonine-protein kinase
LLALLAVGGYFLAARSRESNASIPKSSVAVLPFAVAGSDTVDAYFGEGIADELMTALGKVQGLRVASRTSAIAVGRQRDLDVRQIGSRLGVATVVEGTVRRAGGHLRVTAQLTNAADGLTMWSETYDRESKDVFAVQDEITKSILAKIRPEFSTTATTSSIKKPAGPGTSNPAAYDLYLRGLYLLERRGPGVAKSAEYFTQAIHQDTSFARAYAALAEALEFFPYFAGVSAKSVEARARAAAEKSLKLDPALAEPRVALAMAYFHAFQWNEADAEFRSALLADPTSPVAHTQYGRFLFTLNQIRPALEQFQIARKLDPLAPTASVWLSHMLALLGDTAAAWEESQRVRELDPSLVTARSLLADDRVVLGHADEARAILGQNVPPMPFNGMLAYDLQLIGDTARASAIRRTLNSRPDSTWLVHISRAYTYLGIPDTARALSEMESGLDHGEIVPILIPLADRHVDPVRHTARFAAIVRRVGLEGRGLTELKR